MASPIFFRQKLVVLTAAGLAALFVAPQAAGAADDFHIVLPAGTACAGFDLDVVGTGGNSHMKEFTDANGNLVRTITTGTGSQLTFTNATSGKSLLLKSNGSTNHTSFNPDGSTTVEVTGHTVLILSPTDIPAGPSTTLIVGRLVYTADANQNFTVQKISGKTSDICAQL